MDENKRETLLYIIGFIFLAIYIYVLILFISCQYYLGLFWICYLGILLFSIGIFLKNSDLVLSQVFLLLIPDILWGIDFFYRISFGNTLLGIDNFFFTTNYFSRKILSLQHLITPILGLSALFLLKPKKFYKALIIGFVEIFLILLISLIFPFKEEINCLPTYKGCMFSDPSFLVPYPIFWLFVESLFILISFVILYFIFNKKINKLSKKFIK